jgi:hypothetical protein
MKTWIKSKLNLLSKAVLPQRICFLATCYLSLTAFGQISNSLVVPNDYGDKIAAGNGTTIEGLHQFTYLNSQFQSIGNQEITINSVALRPKLNGPGASLDVVVPAITISMGTFTKPLSQLSAIADNNRGADFTQVYSHENVPLHFVPAGDPDNFSLVFNLDIPFHYNPNNGGFIFEWRASDFQNRSDARIDFVGYPPLQGPVYEATELGDVLGYGGFIVNINYTAVPEPSPLIVMVVLGALGVLASSSKTGRKILGKGTDTDEHERCAVGDYNLCGEVS